MSRHPEVKWAQREDKVYITVLLPDSKDAKVNLQPDGVLSFSATAGSANNLYELNLDLFDRVNVEESKINKGVRSIFCVLEKAEKGWWKKLLKGDGKTPHYIKVDWDKWVDEDDDGGAAGGDLDMGGMDFSNFGGGDDFGGGDSDEEEDTEKIEEGEEKAEDDEKTGNGLGTAEDAKEKGEKASN